MSTNPAVRPSSAKVVPLTSSTTNVSDVLPHYGYGAMPFIRTENAFMNGTWSGTQLAHRTSSHVAESCRFRLIRSRLTSKPQAFDRDDTGARNLPIKGTWNCFRYSNKTFGGGLR
jgi:hypothetical protein